MRRALERIAAGLAAAINAGASANFLAIGDSDTLLVINQAGQDFTADVNVAPAAVLSVSRSFDVTGSGTAGDLWTVTLTVDGVATQVTALFSTSMVSLTGALRDAIDASANFRALSVSQTLEISTEGAFAGKSFTLTAFAPGGSIAEKAVTTNRDVVLHGPAVAGDVWTLTLAAPGGVTRVVSATVVADGDLASLAEDLMDQINLPMNTGFAATFTANVLEVSSVGPNFSKHFVVSYAVSRSIASGVFQDVLPTTIGLAQGVPVVGETWRVTVDGVDDFDHEVLAIDALGTPQSLAQVIAALAQQIVDDSAYDAAARGATLLVLESATFTMEVVVNGAPAATPVDAGNVTVSGTPKAGETVSITAGATTHQHVVRETVALAEIAAGLAARINAEPASRASWRASRATPSS